ncbi:hypothetical protein ACO1BY_13630 [Clostridioides difficile]|uniref:hypothetical protein n=1 Tax=Clostridioides difficile TaxID=1496 RepID=UPI001FABD19F|nr:hypothetical protein [Clostridioides difficile]MDE3609249.1 hypothetical protein [Clostridioides difficile]MDM9790420.1 hypothetical protein [Clostridioides difficile]
MSNLFKYNLSKFAPTNFIINIKASGINIGTSPINGNSAAPEAKKFVIADAPEN